MHLLAQAYNLLVSSSAFFRIAASKRQKPGWVAISGPDDLPNDRLVTQRNLVQLVFQVSYAASRISIVGSGGDHLGNVLDREGLEKAAEIATDFGRTCGKTAMTTVTAKIGGKCVQPVGGDEKPYGCGFFPVIASLILLESGDDECLDIQRLLSARENLSNLLLHSSARRCRWLSSAGTASASATSGVDRHVLSCTISGVVHPEQDDHQVPTMFHPSNSKKEEKKVQGRQAIAKIMSLSFSRERERGKQGLHQTLTHLKIDKRPYCEVVDTTVEAPVIHDP